MTSHTHLIAVPEADSALSNTMRDIHGAYASLFNRKYGLSGHLWQARFYSCVLDEEHLQHAVRYVECNPVRAGMVNHAEEYAWSSAVPHGSGIEDRYLHAGLPFADVITDWSAWLASEPDETTIGAIRGATATGRACGSDAFVQRIEAYSGRCLHPQKRGPKTHVNVIDETNGVRLPLVGERRTSGRPCG